MSLARRFSEHQFPREFRKMRLSDAADQLNAAFSKLSMSDDEQGEFCSRVVKAQFLMSVQQCKVLDDVMTLVQKHRVGGASKTRPEFQSQPPSFFAPLVRMFASWF